MIIWLDTAVVLAIHERQIAEFGGSEGLRDARPLESALALPQQLLACGDPEPDLPALAASLAHGLARNHPFVDGNKRTAHVSMRTFIAVNGGEFGASDDEKYLSILALAEGRMPEAEFAAWLRSHLRVRGASAVHEPRASYTARKRGPSTARARGRTRR